MASPSFLERHEKNLQPARRTLGFIKKNKESRRMMGFASFSYCRAMPPAHAVGKHNRTCYVEFAHRDYVLRRLALVIKETIEKMK